ITKLAFVARIVPVKNLDYALDILTTVTQPVQFDIYGPVEDSAYWQQCEAKMANLPAHIQAHYCGVLAGDQVIDSLAEYHGLLLPTRSENFGHSILEALTAGCLPIISDQTPWRNLADEQVGWDLPLDQPEQFKQAIERLIAMDDATWQQWSANARDKARRFATESGVIEQTRQIVHIFIIEYVRRQKNRLDAEPVFDLLVTHVFRHPSWKCCLRCYRC
ncbi:MAG: glycosyltransferase, partial [Anaerolineae bacterium]|nr:glycosyltransferase [Anaerolineae bacterium]